MSEWLVAHARPIIDSLLYSILGGLILLAFFYVVQKVLPFSMRKEIEEDQNTSLAIVIASVMIGLSIIIAAAIHG